MVVTEPPWVEEGAPDSPTRSHFPMGDQIASETHPTLGDPAKKKKKIPDKDTHKKKLPSTSIFFGAPVLFVSF